MWFTGRRRSVATNSPGVVTQMNICGPGNCQSQCPGGPSPSLGGVISNSMFDHMLNHGNDNACQGKGGWPTAPDGPCAWYCFLREQFLDLNLKMESIKFKSKFHGGFGQRKQQFPFYGQ